MRKLTGKDVFAFGRILSAVNFRDEAKQMMLGKAELTEEQGLDFLYVIIDKATNKACESLIWEFLARPFEMKPEEVSELPFDELFEMLKELRDMNHLAPFFGLVRRMMSGN